MAWTRVSLPERNGWVYFGHESTLPRDWGVDSCLALMAERLTRMTMACNKKWPTEETVVTIYLECIFQICVRDAVIKDGGPDEELRRFYREKYSEFLGLPVTVAWFDPLRFTVAHRIHGAQMRSGWPLQPARLADRKDENNNMLIETCSSNYLKMDYETEKYPLLRQFVRDCNKIPRELFNTQKTPSGPIDAFEGPMEEMVRAGEALDLEDDAPFEGLEEEGIMEDDGEGVGDEQWMLTDAEP